MEFDYGDLEDWKKAGSIAAEALQLGKSMIKPGVKLLDVAEAVENKIKELGAAPGFPTNISLNHVAAHYTPLHNDEKVFSDEIVKLDVGVSYKGAIGDTACTIDLSGENEELVKASEEALQNVLEMIKPGVTLSEIGKVVEETITGKGFEPIRNLSGHGLGRFSVHSPPTIPNYDTGDETALEKGQIIAIEPFATTGEGHITETEQAEIFQYNEKKPVRSAFARILLKDIEKFNGLPFCIRWLTKKHPLFKVNFALKELIRAGVIKAYPTLPEKKHGLVSQSEHSIIVDDPVIVLTK